MDRRSDPHWVVPVDCYEKCGAAPCANAPPIPHCRERATQATHRRLSVHHNLEIITVVSRTLSRTVCRLFRCDECEATALWDADMAAASATIFARGKCHHGDD